MGAYQKDTNQSHRNHVQQIAESKDLARRALLQAENAGVPPGRTVLDAEGSGSLADGPKAQTLLHSAVLDYHDQLAPFQEYVPELWEEEFWETEIPDGRTVRISLESLNNWRMRSVSWSSLEYDEWEGEVVTEHKSKLWLPPGGAAEAYRQLNQILEKLKLAAEVKEADARDINPV